MLGEGAQELSHFPGEAIAGTAYEPPFTYVTDYGPRGHTVLLGDFVTTDEGTGLVHTAIAFGEDDFKLGEEYGITLQNPVRLDGTFDDRVTDFAGRKVRDADEDIVAALESSGKLLRAEPYLHSYPHCWRCDTPLLYYAKASWYIATSQVRDRMLAENERIGWHPDHIKHGRFGKWLEGNVDWALSRDRYWGTPLPIWECSSDDCEERFCAGSREDLTSRGATVPDDLHRPYIDEVVFPCEKCGSEMRRVKSVADTWFDSGAMPFAQFHHPFENTELFEERFPADFICEAIDQTRGWFYTQFAESVLLFDETNFLNCVCLGLILDPEGQKMSKSKGNVVEPWDVIEQHGADAFRWYYFTDQQPWNGYRFSVESVGESVRQFLLTLWNTYSFWVLYANTEGLEPGPAGAPTEGLTELDAWALSRLQGLTATVRERMDDFDCTTAGRAIGDYVEELSNWYVRLSRRRFWEGDAAAFATLRHCLVEVCKLVAPLTPFLADSIYCNLVAGEAAEFGDAPDSVHLADFPEPAEALADLELEAGMEAVRRTVELGRAARAHSKVKMRQPLHKAVVVATAEERPAIERLSDVVASELNVKEIEFVSDESELVSYRVKPNFAALGPRMGKQMPQAKAAIEGLNAAEVTEVLEAGGSVGISIDGHDHSIGADDITMVMEPLEGYEVEAEAGHAVALSLELDDDLRAEGLAREIVHAVQNARKGAGLEVSDRIELGLGGGDEVLDAARAHEAYIAGETLASSVSYEADGGGQPASVGGHELHIAVSRSK